MSNMIGTEFLKGQGLGNRLFCYVTARCLAEDLGVPFCTAGQGYLQADFLDLDLGSKVTDPSSMHRYDEREERIYLPTSAHDMVHGIYIAGADPGLLKIKDNTLVYGNLQDESYFQRHREEIREWLRVKPAFESDEYTADDLCILNMRGSEYEGKPELYLRRRYWVDAMKIMRGINPSMRFMIVTEDEAAAKRLFPSIEAHHFGPEKDYVTVKNARYLIVSNSSFAFFPAYTSQTVRKIIAPQYWARHNVSDGYWASAQNIYDEFMYLGRDGQLRSAEECRQELRSWKKPDTHPFAADDPAVAAVQRRNRRRVLLQKALYKAGRCTGLIR